MCGIAAILLEPRPRPPAAFEAIRRSLTTNLLFNETRGRAATGLALAQDDGQVFIEKMAVPASKFVQTVAYRRLLARVGPQTTLLLGHTRKPTQGSPANGANNHPLQVGSIFGVHNGHIHNDGALFAQNGLKRQAEVDSEIIFRLLAGVTPTADTALYLQQVQAQLRQLEGRFTVIVADRRDPDRLLLVKHQNPLSVHFHPPWQALIFSSRYLYLRKTFGAAVVGERLPAETVLLYHARRLQAHRPLLALPL